MTSFEAKSAGTLAEENMTKMGITWVTLKANRLSTGLLCPESITG